MTQTVTRPDVPAGRPPRSLPPRLRALSQSDRFWGWAAPLLVAVIGGLQRFVHLGRPPRLVFDEVYYVKQGASYLRSGYELSPRAVPSGSPDPFTTGGTDVWATNADFVVHPPVGKWMIAFGQWVFGPANPFGWRFSAALVGTLSILMIGRIARRLLGSTLLGTTAALLLAVDGQHFVHSRTGILDIFVMFWALAAFGCLLIDRDHARRRLLATTTPGQPLGPWLGPRPWRLAAITCLALATGVKWSGLYFTAAFLVMSVLWDTANRRTAGIRHWLPGATLLDGLQALTSMVVLLPSVYLATWAGWFSSTGGYGRQWGAQHPAEPGWTWVPDALRSLWHYHGQIWQFHVNLETFHQYMSNPWSWMILGRPTAFFYDKWEKGVGGCPVTECSQAITALGNPVIWWGGSVAVLVLMFRWALSRDWRAGAVLAGFVGGYLPWFLYQERTIYTFYAVAFVPWVVLALTYVLGMLLGPRGAPEERRRQGALAAGSVVFLAVLTFWFFFPVLAGDVLPRGAWGVRMWFPSWI